MAATLLFDVVAVIVFAVSCFLFVKYGLYGSPEHQLARSAFALNIVLLYVAIQLPSWPQY
jgi:hypothetical protein